MAQGSQQALETRWLPTGLDVIAPDGSEIRLLAKTAAGSMCHCTLPPKAVSRAIVHRSVEEVWYVISGHGQVWRKLGDVEEVAEVGAGCSLNIPVGASFQFRNRGDEPLCLVIVTMPPWPGDQEALPVSGPWLLSD